MSEESPQKGWDSWFSAEQDSSGDEPQAPEHSVPPTPSGEEPETEAEQTNWTVPALGAVLEGREPQEAAGSRPSGQPHPQQSSQPSTDQSQPAQQVRSALESPDAEDGATTQRALAPAPDALATRQVPAAAGPAEQPQADDPAPGIWQPPQAAEATQVVSAAQPAPSTPTPPPSQPAQAWTPAPQSPQDAQPTQQVPQPSPPPAYGQPPQSGQSPYPITPAAPTAALQQPQVAAYPAPAAPAASPLTSYQRPPGYGQVPPQPPTAEVRSNRDEPDPRRPAAASALAGDEPRPRSRRKVFVASGIGAVAIVGLATVLVMNSSSGGGSHAAAPPSGFQPTGTSLTGDAEQTASAFLTAWRSGNFKQAAAYTDDPAAASAALSAYESGLNLNGLQLTATGATPVTPAPSSAGSGSPAASAGATGSSSASAAPPVPSSTAGVVTFNVAAKVGLPAASTSSTASASASGSASASSSGSPSAASSGASPSSSSAIAVSPVSASWSYSSKLTAYEKNGGWWIQWVPSLVAPNLNGSNKIVSLAIPPSAAEVEDAGGNDLSTATDPGVHNIYLALKKSAPAGQGTPGVEIQLQSAAGVPVTSSTDVLSQPVNTGIVKTTITPADETAAQQAVLAHPDSSMVVLQPTTGDILAVANNDGGNDFALTARVAPGSTNKIITSTALLANNLVTSPSMAVTCPPTITVNGTVFHNSNNESEPAGTPFLDDFAASCNNAFGQWYSSIGSTTLATTAQKYYGLNEQWNLGTGLAGPYYNIPTSASDGELFQELFGQGELETAPVAMASVAATVDTGSFKQPIFVPGTAQVGATPLPTNVQQDLYQMMKAVVTQSNGTGVGVFNGVNSAVYGKTGTADVGTSQKSPNSWMVVFDPTLNVAIGCVVLDAGAGASFAGPEAASVLTALQ